MFSGNTAKFNTKVAGLIDSFNELVTKQYLMICPAPENKDERVPLFPTNDKELHKPVEFNIQKLIQLEKGEINDEDTDKELWKCNFERFHQDMR